MNMSQIFGIRCIETKCIVNFSNIQKQKKSLDLMEWKWKNPFPPDVTNKVTDNGIHG